MAKATATCKCATCGSEFEVTAVKSNRREADAWAIYASKTYDECPDCRAKRINTERQTENEASAEAAACVGLPDLQGSEKQIAWAVTIRQKAYDKIRECAKAVRGTDGEMVSETYAGKDYVFSTESYLEWLMTTNTKAHWWIDNRDWFSHHPLIIIDEAEFFAWLDQNHPEAAEEGEAREDAQDEMIVAPENARPGVAEIRIESDRVLAMYSKDDDFRAIVKALGYTWDADRRAWQKRINATTGPAAERAAELGNKLLAGGFAVQIADPEIRRAAVAGSYEPEHQRWITLITAGDYCGWLRIRLVRGEELYGKARAIKGSRYDKPDVAVPLTQWAEVEDFANCYDYRLSEGARSAIEKHRTSIVTVTPAPVKQKKYSEHDPASIMSESADVLEDLIDT